MQPLSSNSKLAEQNFKLAQEALDQFIYGQKGFEPAARTIKLFEDIEIENRFQKIFSENNPKTALSRMVLSLNYLNFKLTYNPFEADPALYAHHLSFLHGVLLVSAAFPEESNVKVFYSNKFSAFFISHDHESAQLRVTRCAQDILREGSRSIDALWNSKADLFYFLRLLGIANRWENLDIQSIRQRLQKTYQAFSNSKREQQNTYSDFYKKQLKFIAQPVVQQTVTVVAQLSPVPSTENQSITPAELTSVSVTDKQPPVAQLIPASITDNLSETSTQLSIEKPISSHLTSVSVTDKQPVAQLIPSSITDNLPETSTLLSTEKPISSSHLTSVSVNDKQPVAQPIPASITDNLPETSAQRPSVDKQPVASGQLTDASVTDNQTVTSSPIFIAEKQPEKPYQKILSNLRHQAKKKPEKFINCFRQLKEYVLELEDKQAAKFIIFNFLKKLRDSGTFSNIKIHEAFLNELKSCQFITPREFHTETMALLLAYLFLKKTKVNDIVSLMDQILQSNTTLEANDLAIFEEMVDFVLKEKLPAHFEKIKNLLVKFEAKLSSKYEYIEFICFCLTRSLQYYVQQPSAGLQIKISEMLIWVTDSLLSDDTRFWAGNVKNDLTRTIVDLIREEHSKILEILENLTHGKRLKHITTTNAFVIFTALIQSQDQNFRNFAIHFFSQFEAQTGTPLLNEKNFRTMLREVLSNGQEENYTYAHQLLSEFYRQIRRNEPSKVTLDMLHILQEYCLDINSTQVQRSNYRTLIRIHVSELNSYYKFFKIEDSVIYITILIESRDDLLTQCAILITQYSLKSMTISQALTITKALTRIPKQFFCEKLEKHLCDLILALGEELFVQNRGHEIMREVSNHYFILLSQLNTATSYPCLKLRGILLYKGIVQTNFESGQALQNAFKDKIPDFANQCSMRKNYFHLGELWRGLKEISSSIPSGIMEVLKKECVPVLQNICNDIKFMADLKKGQFVVTNDHLKAFTQIIENLLPLYAELSPSTGREVVLSLMQMYLTHNLNLWAVGDSLIDKSIKMGMFPKTDQLIRKNLRQFTVNTLTCVTVPLPSTLEQFIGCLIRLHNFTDFTDKKENAEYEEVLLTIGVKFIRTLAYVEDVKVVELFKEKLFEERLKSRPQLERSQTLLLWIDACKTEILIFQCIRKLMQKDQAPNIGSINTMLNSLDRCMHNLTSANFFGFTSLINLDKQHRTLLFLADLTLLTQVPDMGLNTVSQVCELLVILLNYDVEHKCEDLSISQLRKGIYNSINNEIIPLCDELGVSFFKGSFELCMQKI